MKDTDREFLKELVRLDVSQTDCSAARKVLETCPDVADKAGNFTVILNHDAVDGLADQVCIYIKNANDIKSVGPKTGVLGQCLPHIAGAYHNHIILFINSKNPSDFIKQVVHVVSVSLLSKSAKIIQILANLRSRYFHFGTEFAGRNPFDSLLFQFSKVSVITRQTFDNRS